MKFVVNDVLLHLDNLKDLFVGVNKVGANAAASLRRVDQLFDTDHAICIFPAGLVSRRKKGRVSDLQWKKTFVSRAKKYKKPIFPVHINGELSSFFYNLANFREKSGIKTNIEMLYLVNEMFKQRNKKMDVVFGDQIMPETLDNSKSNLAWAQTIKQNVYELAKLK